MSIPLPPFTLSDVLCCSVRWPQAYVPTWTSRIPGATLVSAHYLTHYSPSYHFGCWNSWRNVLVRDLPWSWTCNVCIDSTILILKQVEPKSNINNSHEYNISNWRHSRCKSQLVSCSLRSCILVGAVNSLLLRFPQRYVVFSKSVASCVEIKLIRNAVFRVTKKPGGISIHPPDK